MYKYMKVNFQGNFCYPHTLSIQLGPAHHMICWKGGFLKALNEDSSQSAYLLPLAYSEASAIWNSRGS